MAASPNEVADAQVQQYQASIQRLINCLSDPDRNIRRQALQSLQTKLFRGDAATPKAPLPILQALFGKPLLHPLVNLLADQVEKCRSLAVETLLDAVKLLPDVCPVLPQLIPAIAARVGRIPVIEPSEELRLQLVNLTLATIPRIPPPTTPNYIPDLIGILQRALEDPFHDIKKSACSAIAALCAAIPPPAAPETAPKLVPALLTNLGHQHSRVRLTCTHALNAVVLAGLPAGLLETTIAPALRPLATDRAANVREALFSSLAAWLGHPTPATTTPTTPNPPTTATYAPALLPILLLGLTDPQDTVAALTLQLLTSVGQLYLSQPHSHPTCSTPLTTPADAPAPTITYLPPFTARPDPGPRLLVAHHLPSIIPPTLQGLREWTTTLRVLSARCLYSIAILAESEVTPHLPQLLPAFCSAVADDDQQVALLTVKSVHAVGACVEPQLWVPLALEHVCSSSKTPGQRASALIVLSALLYATATSARPLPPPLLHTLADGLVSDDLLASTDHPDVRAQLLSVLTNILRLPDPPLLPHPAPPPLQQISQQLLWVLLQVLGHELPDAPRPPPAPAPPPPPPPPATPAPAPAPPQPTAPTPAAHPLPPTPAAATLEALAARCGQPSAAHLTAQHAPALLPRLTPHAPTWSARSPPYLVLRALLLTTHAPALAPLLPALAATLRPILQDHERDPPLRLSLLRLLDLLLESPTTAPALSGPNAALVLSQLLLPPLVWRAGKSAAAVRFAAITALATMLRNHLAPPEALTQLINDGTLLPLLFQSLEEDWYVDIRSVCCHVMEQLLLAVGVALSLEHVRATYIELTKRLDDSNNGVRVAACGALRALCAGLTAGYCNTNAGYLAQGVVVHMDDSDKAVQEAACLVLEALAAVKPEATAREVEKARERFRSKHYCDRVLAACQKAQAA